jgi:putative phosphoesterase
MKIAIVSDTHSRYQTVEAALQKIEAHGVDLLIHCGDIEDADAVMLFPAGTHFVFGNCDVNRAGLRLAMKHANVTLHEPFGQLELDGVKLAFVHGDDQRLLRQLEEAGEFAYLFHGHTHQRRDERSGPTRVINPGALHRAAVKTFAVLDLASGELETVTV